MTAAAMVAVLVVSGCHSQPSKPGGKPAVTVDPEVTWANTSLPRGFVPQLVSATGEDLLVGGRYRDDSKRPHLLLLLRTDSGWSQPVDIPVRPVTPEGKLSNWKFVAVEGNRIQLVGIRRAPGSRTTQWTTWSGTTTGISELKQSPRTFGGPGMGTLAGLTLAGGEATIVGTWKATNPDVAIWRLRGTTWQRGSSTGTPLQGVGDPTSPLAVAACGSALALAHTTKQAGNNQKSPAIYFRATARSGWRQTLQPTGDASEDAVQVTGIGCPMPDLSVATGTVGDRLAMWYWDRWSGQTGATGPLSIPVRPGETIQNPTVGTKGASLALVSEDKVKVVRFTDPTAADFGDVVSGSITDGPPSVGVLGQTTSADRLITLTRRLHGTIALDWTTLPEPPA